MADSQKMGSGAASGGQRIDDHKAWMGSRGKNVPLPDGAKMKQISEEEGAGSVMRYEDKEEAIKHVQKEGVKQLKNRPLKPGYR